MDKFEEIEESGDMLSGRENSPRRSHNAKEAGIDIDILYFAYLKYMQDSGEAIVSLYDRDEDKQSFLSMHKPYDKQTFAAMYDEMDSASRGEYAAGLLKGYEQERDSWAQTMADRIVREAIKKTGRG